MRQQRPQSRCFNLPHDPIPVPRGLHRYRRTGFAPRQVAADRSRFVPDSLLPYRSALDLFPLHPTVVLVTIERDILSPGATPSATPSL